MRNYSILWVYHIARGVNRGALTITLGVPNEYTPERYMHVSKNFMRIAYLAVFSVKLNSMADARRECCILW